MPSSTLPPPPTAVPAVVEEIWCLCLHGCRQTAEIFSHQLSGLETLLASVTSIGRQTSTTQNHKNRKRNQSSHNHHTAPCRDRNIVIRLDFLEAPHPMPKLFEEDAVVPKSWCQPLTTSPSPAAAAPPPPSGSPTSTETPLRQSTTQKRGSASLLPPELEEENGEHGSTVTDESGTSPTVWDYHVSDQLLDAKLRERRYHFLLGFSQGGLMIARCVARHEGRIPTGPLSPSSGSNSDNHDHRLDETKAVPSRPSYVEGLVFIASPDIRRDYPGPSPSNSTSSCGGYSLSPTPPPQAPFPEERAIEGYLFPPLLLKSNSRDGIDAPLSAPETTGVSSASSLWRGPALRGVFLPDDLPSLHIMGERDSVVPLAESDRFRQWCGPAAMPLVHRHAHSAPQGKEALRSVKDFFVKVISTLAEEKGGRRGEETNNTNNNNNPPPQEEEKAPSASAPQRSAEELAALREARENELEMVGAMYGDENVEKRDKPTVSSSIAAVVRLPLLGEEVWDHTEFDPLVQRWLGQLRLELHLPHGYPEDPPSRIRVRVVDTTTTTSTSPEVPQAGSGVGSSSSSTPASRTVPHSVRFSRWAGELERELASYQQEELGPGTEMVMPLLLHAAARAAEALEALGEWLSAAREGKEVEAAMKDRAREEEVAALAAGAALKERIEEETLDDDVRQGRAMAADEEAVRLLLQETSAHRSTVGKQVSPSSPLTAASEIMAETQTLMAGAAAPGGGGKGSWKLQIGLIGKPSAGKSTFFNAITDPESEAEAAKVAAFPFTTIEPNTGTGYAPLRCPCSALASAPPPNGLSIAGVRTSSSSSCCCCCTARYGHVHALGSSHFRRHPVTVKDVAGLVKGAYQGRGKGNQFLNDLCDADVLVHVVDGAGATEADGTACPEGQGSVLEDISWVRAEVHFWIYDNLVSKWASILKQPQRLRVMFSGYRSGPSFVDFVLSKLGVNTNVNTSVMGGGGGASPASRGLAGSSATTTMASGNKSQKEGMLWLEDALPRWGWAEIHLLVAMYVRLRFPIVVALNKADLPSAAGIREKLVKAYPNEILVPMSARVEWDLLQLRKKKRIHYVSGEGGFISVTPPTGTTTSSSSLSLPSTNSNGGHAEASSDPADTKEKTRGAKSPTNAQLARVQQFFDAQHQIRGHASETGATEPHMDASPALLSSTGVQDVLAVAIASCAMTVVFPVADFAPFFSTPTTTFSGTRPIPIPPNSGGGEVVETTTTRPWSPNDASDDPEKWHLPQAVCFRCGTPAEVVFGSLERMGAVEGKLVRFEAIHVRDLQRYHGLQGPSKGGGAAPDNSPPLSTVIASHTLVLRKTDPVPAGAVLIRVLTNKRQERKK